MKPSLIVLVLAALASPLWAQERQRDHCANGDFPASSGPEITTAGICATIAVLAADSLEGREAGSPGSDRASKYLAERFRSIGLEPLNGDFLQSFTFSAAVRRDPHASPDPSSDGDAVLSTANVIGIVPGIDPRLADQAVVIGAHYDHLGFGGRGSLVPGERAIHNGADDNASGVAALLELAQQFAARPMARTLIFVAFGGEELGTLGSQYYIAHPLWPVDQTVAMLNLDMVGRLREQLTVHGTGTSPTWVAILDDLDAQGSHPTIARVPDGFGPSDQSSFYGAQIPVLWFFTGAHEQYHRPTDDLETIDGAGAVRVANLVSAITETITSSGLEIPYAVAPTTQRRAAAFSVGLGVIPEYSFPGPGLKVASVRPDGPADQAGVSAGDVLLKLADRDIKDVYGYTAVLSDLKAGVSYTLVYEHEGELHTVSVEPASR
jgi:hypothetical protein